MSSVKTVLLPIVDVEYCCPFRAIIGQKADELYERDNAHAVIRGSRSCRDRIEMGREQHGIV